MLFRSLVQVWPRTGRQHQIRRHFKHVSHPLVGDASYGKGELNRYFEREMGLGRLALHAAALRFTPPGEAAPHTVSAPLPADFATALSRLGIAPIPPLVTYRGANRPPLARLETRHDAL